MHPEWHFGPTEATNLQGSLRPRLGAGLLLPNALADALRAPCPSFPVPAASFPFTLCLELSLAPQKPDALGESSAGRWVQAESQAAGVAGYSQPFCPAPVWFYPL